MSLTAYLSPSLLQQLTDVSVTPGAGNTGYPLVWNNSTSRFELAVLGMAGGGTGQVTRQAAINALAGATTSGQYLRGNGTNVAMSAIQAADVPTLNQNTTGTAANVTGVVAVANGGWGTNTGSFTSPGAITLAAGGTNQNINLNPSGNGKVIAPNLQLGSTSDYQITLGGGGLTNGILLNSTDYGNLPWPGQFNNLVVLNSRGFGFVTDGPSVEPFGPYSTSLGVNIRANRDLNLFVVYQQTPFYRGAAFQCRVGIGTDNPSAYFHVAFATESTSTSTGCAVFSGGVGIVGNLNVGGNLRFAGGTVPATATSAGTAGDIRYNGSFLYICTATNTWVRTALSTW